MIKVIIQYTKDNELIEAHCLKSQMQIYADETIVLNPEGKEEQ